MADFNDDILSRLEKLKALAEGTKNANEAAVAFSKMQKLLDEYDLSAEEISGIDSDVSQIVEMVLVPTAGNTSQWKTFMANSIARLHGCKLILNKYIAGYGRVRAKIKRQPVVVGKKQSVSGVIYIVNNITAQLERLCDAAAENECVYGNVKKWKNTWLWGAAFVIVERMKREVEQNNTQARALIISDRLGLVDEYLRKYGEMKNLQESKMKNIDEDVLLSGARAAKNVSVQKAAAAGIGKDIKLIE